jgi:DNA-directed RNA polymerase subunit RPC12/RpoP
MNFKKDYSTESTLASKCHICGKPIIIATVMECSPWLTPDYQNHFMTAIYCECKNADFMAHKFPQPSSPCDQWLVTRWCHMLSHNSVYVDDCRLTHRQRFVAKHTLNPVVEAIATAKIKAIEHNRKNEIWSNEIVDILLHAMVNGHKWELIGRHNSSGKCKNYQRNNNYLCDYQLDLYGKVFSISTGYGNPSKKDEGRYYCLYMTEPDQKFSHQSDEILPSIDKTAMLYGAVINQVYQEKITKANLPSRLIPSTPISDYIHHHTRTSRYKTETYTDFHCPGCGRAIDEPQHGKFVECKYCSTPMFRCIDQLYIGDDVGRKAGK